MRLLLTLSVLAFAVFLFPSSQANASGVVLNASCNTLGTTQMSDDHTAILLCAFPSPSAATSCGNPSACKWKAMSGGDNSPPGTLCGAAEVPDFNSSVTFYIDATGEYFWNGPASASLQPMIPCNGVDLTMVLVPSHGFHPGGAHVVCPTGYSARPWRHPFTYGGMCGNVTDPLCLTQSYILFCVKQ